jgi:galactose-1-phosphate uridylyltransferase
VVIFDEHHPLRFTRESIADALDTGRRWAEAAHQADPQAVYYFFMWNCLWKSGASILHGHAQTTVSREMHYGRVEALRQAALRYAAESGRSYIEDLVRAHWSLGLARSIGPVQVLAHLTPIKEKEIVLVGPAVDADFAGVLYTVLEAYVQRMGVRAFNVALYQHPLAPVAEDWSVLPPVMARVVDRGDLNNRTADVGAMELYAASVVSSDPFRVIEAL